MKKKIKIKFIGDFKTGYISFFFKILKKKYSIEKTEKNFDLLIYDFLAVKKFNIFSTYKGKKVIISGENCDYNIDYQRSIFTLIVLLIKKIANKLFFYHHKLNKDNFSRESILSSRKIKERENKLFVFFKKLIYPKKIMGTNNYFYTHHTAKLLNVKKKIFSFIENITPFFLKNKRKSILLYFRNHYQSKNEYAILSNICKNDNVLNYPLFFSSFYARKKNFITIKKKKIYEKKNTFVLLLLRIGHQKEE